LIDLGAHGANEGGLVETRRLAALGLCGLRLCSTGDRIRLYLLRQPQLFLLGHLRRIRRLIGLHLARFMRFLLGCRAMHLRDHPSEGRVTVGRCWPNKALNWRTRFPLQFLIFWLRGSALRLVGLRTGSRRARW
jgi:hypothetical protein